MSCFLVLRVFHEFFRRDGKIINELIAIGKKLFLTVSKNVAVSLLSVKMR